MIHIALVATFYCSRQQHKCPSISAFERILRTKIITPSTHFPLFENLRKDSVKVAGCGGRSLNPSTKNTEAGGPHGQSHPWLHSHQPGPHETLPQTQRENQMSCRMNEHCALLPTSEYEVCALLSASPHGSRAQLLRLQPAWDDLRLLMPCCSQHTLGALG